MDAEVRHYTMTVTGNGQPMGTFPLRVVLLRRDNGDDTWWDVPDDAHA